MTFSAKDLKMNDPFVLRRTTSIKFWGWIERHSGGFVAASARRKARRRLCRQALAEFHARLPLLGPGDVVFDFGANRGDYTAALAATGATVYAYEPDPHSFALCKQRFAGQSNVTIFNKAVAAESGTLTLRRVVGFEEDPVKKSLGSSVTPLPGVQFSDKGIEVEVTAFAQALSEAGRPASLIKMDIEGAEFDILDAICADPSAFPFAAMFVETHERIDPAAVPRVATWLRAAEGMKDRHLNLYWQ
ncbi:MAG: FkbM family methyltransferase [Rhodobacteraceae bacterium]|nr:FkbM family methyltransferase [Paracoccaceae bacterium]